MREIKFRAWLNKDLDPFMAEVCEIYFDRNEVYVGAYSESLDTAILMQYTGLKDKNGKEIFEGDIIQWGPLGSEERGRIIDVSFWDGAFRFGQGAEELEGESLGDFAVDLYTQVLGNIYENPELVEEAQ